MKYVRSSKIILGPDLKPKSMTLEIQNGKIAAHHPYDFKPKDQSSDHDDHEIFKDFGDVIVMPGLVDTHAHINEPGRTEWEGFETATKAAAVGGITTVIDMPLNSLPPTTTVRALNIKRESAENNCTIDYGFWGGIIPGNFDELEPMIKAGVAGFKCFMIDSGVPEFPPATEADLEKALPLLAKYDIPLIAHAELESPESKDPESQFDRASNVGTDGKAKNDSTEYRNYLKSRPQKWEVDAIKMLIRLSKASGARVHIVHLSASDALPCIEKARSEGVRITAETCPHYLVFSSESIPNGKTLFKCAPPIRERQNQNALWDGLKNGVISMIVSDHSPCTPDLKKLETGDFEKAWGGIAGLQFSLASVYTESLNHDMPIESLVRLMASEPAKLIGIQDCKGSLQVGCNADFILFDEAANVQTDSTHIFHRHKLTPYQSIKMKGKVIATYLRGRCVFSEQMDQVPLGKWGQEISFQSQTK